MALSDTCSPGKAEATELFWSEGQKKKRKKTKGDSNPAISTTYRIVREQISWNCTAQGYDMQGVKLAAAKDISTNQCNEVEISSPQPLKFNAVTQTVPVVSKCSHIYIDCCWIWSCCSLRIRRKKQIQQKPRHLAFIFTAT